MQANLPSHFSNKRWRKLHFTVMSFYVSPPRLKYAFKWINCAHRREAFGADVHKSNKSTKFKFSVVDAWLMSSA